MSKNWYPIINYDKCIGCMACIKKCKRGVYQIGSNAKPKVINPDNCVEGCHGCGNICPTNAITYFGDSGSNEKINSCGGCSSMSNTNNPVMEIFEPAMCCDTGLCGISINPELLRISTVINTLKKNNIAIKRFNLSNAPMEFVNKKVVNDFINNKGAEKLPVILLNGKIVIFGRYPTNEEIIKLLNLPQNSLSNKNEKSSGCNCKGGCC